MSEHFSTNLKGDIAEQAVVLECLKKGWEVLKPIGDRLAYDLVIDTGENLLKIQVKSAWYDQAKDNHVVDVRRTKTNRRRMIRSSYLPSDFNFAIIFLQEQEVFYILPFAVFDSFKSEIHFVESDKRQRKPKSHQYREAWHLLTEYCY